MLQLVLGNLLVPDPQRECDSTVQRMAQGEETLQVVVLVQERDDLLRSGTSKGVGQKTSIGEETKSTN